MNPWKQTLLEFTRDVLRFSLWGCVMLNGFLLAVFSIAFVGCSVWRIWGWLWRNVFNEPW